jgi:hypothetical protein
MSQPAVMIVTGGARRKSRLHIARVHFGNIRLGNSATAASI